MTHPAKPFTEPDASRLAGEMKSAPQPLTAEYEACIKRKLMRNGRHEVSCKLGLWSVSGGDRDRVEREARHYWIQYYEGDEYAALLNGSPAPAQQ